MKMTVYALQPEEKPYFESIGPELGMDLTMTDQKPSLENLSLAVGADAINVVSDVVLTEEFWRVIHDLGIRAAVTRTIGAEHMNAEIAARYGIPVFSITYSPSSVADYAIMMMLMVLRHIKPMLLRYAGQDYTASGLMGRELPNLTVGILGAGRIGSTVIRHLSGFGCKSLYWSRKRRPELDSFGTFTDLDTLLAECDIVSLHLAANVETFHFMDQSRFSRMKPGAVLINTARGTLVDSDALIEALASGHLSGAGLDVFDGDRSIYYRDYKNHPVQPRQMAVLNAMPNVLMLPHMAYFTDQAVEDMVRNSLLLFRDYYVKNLQ